MHILDKVNIDRWLSKIFGHINWNYKGLNLGLV